MKIIIITLGIGMIVAAAGMIHEQSRRIYSGRQRQPQPARIPYRNEIQVLLRGAGYDIAADGRIGAETLAAWADYENTDSRQAADNITAEAIEQERKNHE